MGFILAYHALLVMDESAWAIHRLWACNAAAGKHDRQRGLSAITSQLTTVRRMRVHARVLASHISATQPQQCRRSAWKLGKAERGIMAEEEVAVSRVVATCDTWKESERNCPMSSAWQPVFLPLRGRACFLLSFRDQS